MSSVNTFMMLFSAVLFQDCERGVISDGAPVQKRPFYLKVLGRIPTCLHVCIRITIRYASAPYDRRPDGVRPRPYGFWKITLKQGDSESTT